MNLALLGLSRKYARAFFNIFCPIITFEDLKNIQDLKNFLEERKSAFLYIQIPFLSDKIKKETFLKILNKFNLKNIFERLVDLLIKHKRLFMLIDILEQIIEIAHAKFKIEEFTIESSSSLTKEQLNNLQKMLEKKVGKKIIYSTKIDPCLIAGIKVYSNTLGLENSVRLALVALSKAQ